MEGKAAFLDHLDDMIGFQQKKLLKLAREVIPHLTPEDIRNPQDFPQLGKDVLFNYEDGVLNGLLSMRTSYLSYLKGDLE